MAEPNQYTFNYDELVEALLKKQGIHEGVWGIYFEFGIQGANAPGPSGEPLPIAIVPIVKVGLQRAKEGIKYPGEVDAAIVNPRDAAKRSRS